MPRRSSLALLALALPWLACSAARTAPPSPPGTAPREPTLPSATAVVPEAPALAFPGALGWAARTPGGRKGAIVRVTSLAASGPGSLAEALAAEGPRTVVFEMSGVIDLELNKLEIKHPFLTVAGQTAPPPGITLIRGGLVVKTHDVVIRHLRVRPGEAGQPKGSGWEMDAITTSTGARDVIVDHCSTTWATDENLSASGERFRGETPDAWRGATSHRITFSNNIVAEGLSNSSHRKGEHSKGSLIHDNVTDVAVIGNLFASNVERNPFFKGGARGIVVNNFVANPKKYAMKYTLVEKEWGEEPQQLGQMAVVGNVFVHGPDTEPDVPLVFASGVGKVEIFLADNQVRDRSGREGSLLGGSVEHFVRVPRAPSWPEGYGAMPVGEVPEWIRREAGARPWDRDAIDARIVEQALRGGGKIIDSEAEVGGYPDPGGQRAPFDPAAWDLDSMTRLAAPR